jgi:hypothetical protein
MNTQSSIIRAGAVCAAVGAVLLVGMVVVGGGALEAMAILGQPGTPEQYAGAIRPAVGALLWAMALDNVFLIAYTGAFIGAAGLLWARARGFAAVGLGFVLLLAGLDVMENSVTVDMARAVQRGIAIPGWEISGLGLVEQVKYACGALAVVLFAVGLIIGLPQSRFAKVVAGLFLVFPLTNVIKIVGGSSLALVFWMWVMLVASAGLLWQGRNP